MNETETTQKLSQTSYEPSPWEDSSWPIIGHMSETNEFNPLEIGVVAVEAHQVVDPMFADFGGRYAGESASRWHLPDALSAGRSRVVNEPEQPQEPMVTMTEQEFAEVRQQDYQAGVRDAAEQAAAESHATLQAAQQRIEQTLLDMQQQLAESLQTIQQQATQLALAIAKKIIDRAVEINPEYIVDILASAIRLKGTAAIRVIRVSPQDFEFIQLVGVGKSIPEFDAQWQFVEDPSIKAGCVIETSAGVIDYQLDPAFERIQEQVVKITR